MNRHLIDCWHTPDSVKTFSDEDWQALLGQAYVHVMVARVFGRLREQQLDKHIPDYLRWQFESAWAVSEAHHRDVMIEVEHINRALRMAAIRPVYLKGAAYNLAKDNAGIGRIYSDIDIYVAAAKLPSAENALKIHGWHFGEMDQYDRQYYRQWMHEIPPLVNRSRGTTLDVHHSLLPLTSRFAFDASKLKVMEVGESQVLEPVDRLLHCIVHLMMETEFEKGLRDLTDIDLLCQQFSQSDEGFWDKLLTRTAEFGVGRLVFYGLRYSHMILGTDVPAEVSGYLQQRYGPARWLQQLMDWVWQRALINTPTQDQRLLSRLAHFSLFVRGHWIKMPLVILLGHSARKSWNNLRGAWQDRHEISGQ